VFSEIILTPEASVSLLNNGNLVASLPLESLPGSALISVLVQAVPEIKRLLVERKTVTADRASLLEKSAIEFKKVAAAIPKSVSESS
jgi:hypothetical protein